MHQHVSLTRIADIVPLVVFLLTAGLIMGVWWSHQSRQTKADQVRLELISEQIKHSVEQGVQGRLGLIKLMRDQWAAQAAPDRRAFMDWCNRIFDEFPGFQAVNWVTDQGVIQWVYPPETNSAALGFDLSEHPVAGPVWRRAKITQSYTVTPGLELLQSGTGFAAYFPITFRDGTKGFLNLVFRSAPLFETFLGEAKYTAYDFRITNEDLVLYASRPNLPKHLPQALSHTFTIRGNPWRLEVGHTQRLGRLSAEQTGNILLIVGLLMVLLFSFSIRVILYRQVQQQEQQRTMMTLMENLPGMVYRYALRTPYTLSFVSQGAYSLTGYRDEELIDGRGACYSDLIFDEFKPALEKMRLTACKTKSPTETIYRIRTRSGISRWVWDRTCAIFDWRGSIVAMEGFITDVSERIEAEQELLRHHNRLEEIVAQRTNELKATNHELLHEIKQRRIIEEHLNQSLHELERANRDLEEFAYVTSHDLKAPLRGINSMAQWLAEDYGDRLDETGSGYLATISERAGRLTQLIEGILDYSRISNASEIQHLDSGAVADAVMGNLTVPTGLSLVRRGTFPEVLYDQTQLFQVFQNLVSNAVKHMGKPEGRIEIFGDENETDWLFSVADDGVGIPEDQQERVFKLFQTVTEGDRNQGNTGIGLSVVKKIVERNHGFIKLQSKPGQGCKVTFSIPKNQSPFRNNLVHFLVLDANPEEGRRQVAMLQHAGFSAHFLQDKDPDSDAFRTMGRKVNHVLLDNGLVEERRNIMETLIRLNPEMTMAIVLKTNHSTTYATPSHWPVSGVIKETRNLSGVTALFKITTNEPTQPTQTY
ncbi:ATP-binding protein [Acanthopleuribacter pedis]|uniref:histidine kinase n=1 Tax=Acanthopleuribacter pedis TaxID=442870 RepID=A0A8J7U547_9BACT|nr:ATP-binding protein [Acanthopleuribacter pedis]MBO1320113.1 PAS domain-containing protein [Acanthopleuribacter pedis]